MNIPSKNENNCNQKIKIQLTSDNKCIIKSTLESAEKSKATLNKSEYSINIPDLKDINDNELLTLSKSLTNNQNNDNEANSNLLISFSNISELNKTGELSLWMKEEQNKNNNLNENKENIDLNNDIVNINLNDKSKCSDISNKSNKSNKSKNKRGDIFDCKKKINKKLIKNKNQNQFVGNKKIFKNIKSQNTDNLNIIHKIEKKESKNNNILTNQCTNFSFGGNNSDNNTNNYNSNNNNNNNDNNKNEDYASPTFNVKINFNSLESNNNNVKNKNESRNKNITNMNNNNKINKDSKTTNNSINNKINNNSNNDKFKKIELSIKNPKNNNTKKKNLSSSNLLPKHNQTSLDKIKINHNKDPHKQKLDKYPCLNSNRTFDQNILSHLYNKNKSFTNIKMSSNKSNKKLTASSSPKNLKEKKNNLSIKSNSSSASRNLINTSKILLKKNKSSVNIKFKEKVLTNKNSSNKIKIPTKEKDINTTSANSKNKNRNIIRKSPLQNTNKTNKFNSTSKRIKTNKKSPPKILDKSVTNSKKEKIQERIAKTSLNTYRNTKNNDTDLIKNKKNSSLVYSRKRNLNERYNKIFNNSSNNSSKDSTRIYHSIINRSLHSIDKSKNKINNLNSKKKLVYNNNDCNKNKNKKFIAIQNFSRYKKKSVLFYKNKNNETNINTNNNYFITDKKF